MHNQKPVVGEGEADLVRPTHDDILAENAALRERVAELEQLVVRDTLTPLFNRRHFMEELERLRVRAERHGTQYGIIYIDVDHLKSTNDRFGHKAGDELLICVADILQSHIRRFDVAARMGGDEFALLLDSLDETEIRAKMQTLKEKVHGCELNFGGARVRPKISLGHAMVDSKIEAADLLALADADMYVQKKAGR